jgi:hypothetical protein
LGARRRRRIRIEWRRNVLVTPDAALAFRAMEIAGASSRG